MKLSGATGWWNRAPFWQRVGGVSAALVVVLVVALITVTIRQSATISSLRSDLVDLEASASALSDESSNSAEKNTTLSAELAATSSSLAAAEQRVAELTPLVERVSELEAMTSDMEVQLAQQSEQLAESGRRIASLRIEQGRANRLVAELSAAYDSELATDRQALTASALGFACSWGAQAAVDETPLASVTGQVVFQGFLASAELEELTAATPGVNAVFEIADVLGEEPLTATVDEIGVAAAACWQKADAQINADLYKHQKALRDAMLDAACTHGADRAPQDFDETAAYQAWAQDLGWDAVGEYLSAVVRRFVSVEAFVVISETDLEAEDVRCAEDRSRISPKGAGTWNVGEEIKPGVWKAFDVSDCYWARLSSNGDIRANHFGDALRISVNVRSSDGQFEVSRCEFYFANP